MKLLESTQRLLEEAGYSVRPHTGSDPSLIFEDQSLLGFVSVHPTVASLLTGWKGEQDAFLRQFAAALRRHPEKAWNLYSVFLTSEKAAEDQMRLLLGIEEDFRATRKIAQSGLTEMDQVQRALYPLLPISHLVRLVAVDFSSRLRSRVNLPASAFDALTGDAKPAEVADRIVEEQ